MWMKLALGQRSAEARCIKLCTHKDTQMFLLSDSWGSNPSQRGAGFIIYLFNRNTLKGKVWKRWWRVGWRFVVLQTFLGWSFTFLGEANTDVSLLETLMMLACLTLILGCWRNEHVMKVCVLMVIPPLLHGHDKRLWPVEAKSWKCECPCRFSSCSNI